MEFEVLKKSHLKRKILIGVLIVGIISAIVLNFTRAKYRTTQSIPLVNGTINYTLADLNIIGLYIDGVEAEELDSSKNYTLNTDQSTCTYKDGSTINDLELSYDSETKTFTITPYTTKGTKCKLYFDEYVPTAGNTILANYPTQLTRTNFNITVTNTTTETIYYADTSKGRTYYFAGNPTDNWVYFGGFYWRIIRINEDGTIRMIYQGTSAYTGGTVTQIQEGIYNSPYNNNMYVGYMYASNQVHGLTSSSTIKGVLDEWYQKALKNVADKIDGNAGFCGDRQPSTSPSISNGQGGTGKTVTYYGIRSKPTLECENDSDLYTTSGSEDGNKALTYPIGLISLNEARYAGGTDDNNTDYFLCTNEPYWTMSPSHFNSAAYIYGLNYNGRLVGWGAYTDAGIRPVINLKANVQITGGTGTSTNPYIVN